MERKRRRRVHLRLPGVKSDTKIGPLGPFRGRLGVHWVIAPIVLAVILGVVAALALTRGLPGL